MSDKMKVQSERKSNDVHGRSQLKYSAARYVYLKCT